MAKIIKPALSFRGSLTPINKARVSKIVQHHMAHKSWNLSDVHNFHRNSNGWAGIGYNYWIDFDGNIYEGRGMNVGAHVGGHNSHTIGVGYQGDFTSQKMTDEQLRAGIALNKWLIAQLPNVSASDIIGHRDLAPTACPGANFRMKELIAGVNGQDVKVAKPATKTASAASIPSKLTVDGKWGADTTRAIQRALKTPVDGIISGQPRNSVTQALYGNTVSYGSSGSPMVRALQRKIGAKADGKLGPATVRKLQAYLGTVQDGKLSRPSLVVKEMQRRLNADTF